MRHLLKLTPDVHRKLSSSSEQMESSKQPDTRFYIWGSQIRILKKNLKVVFVIIAVDSHNVVHEMNSSHKTFH